MIQREAQELTNTTRMCRRGKQRESEKGKESKSESLMWLPELSSHVVVVAGCVSLHCASVSRCASFQYENFTPMLALLRSIAAAMVAA